MKNSIFIGITVAVIITGFLIYQRYRTSPVSAPLPSGQVAVPANSANIPLVSLVAENLDTPWAIVFLPDQSMLVTQRSGTVLHITLDGATRTLATVEDAQEIGEGGLLGMTLHPDFSSNKYVYLYYTYTQEKDTTYNRVVRVTYGNDGLTNEQVIVDRIPGAANHNGGRIVFGPDRLLYITTGDAEEPSQAQNTGSLAGKILRVTDQGKAASGNPFSNRVYSYGHRNPQGIVWDKEGRLWSTEHGRSGIQSGLDELNMIERGSNYGWPEIQGDDERKGMVKAQLNSGGSTWAPGGIAFVDGFLFFGGLRGSALYKADIQDKQIELTEYFRNEYGRIREVVVGPDQMLYITTSNEDGRGISKNTGDMILRINPQKL
jgi:glucose/arabinose dehydrogenase